MVFILSRPLVPSFRQLLVAFVRLQKIIATPNAIICCIMLFSMVSLPEMISKEVTIMTTAVRINDDLVRDAKIYSKIDKRSLTGQIEYWARIGKCAEENPDLTYSLIKDILIGIAELEQGESSEYKLG
jgi:ParD-like antitoxin of type II bacterial toxin-antitoxin system